MSFYRGYIVTDNKKSTMKFKGVADGDLLNLEQVKRLPEYAGIMAKDAILIDIDDMEQADILYKICIDMNVKCKILKSRSGMHFLFKNNAVKKCPNRIKLAIGLEADVKSGFKNSYEVLKINGKERELLYDISDGEEYQILPRWLHPVNRYNTKFVGLGEGDGRNQELYNYILTLQDNDFTVEEIKETITIINKYVFAVPLSDEELAVILRDEAFQAPGFFKGKKFLFDKFARYIRNNNHIIKINNQLHIYKDGIYVANQGDIENAMIGILPELSKHNRNETLSYLDVLIREDTKSIDANMIAFENGLFNITDDSFIEFTPEHIITNKIKWNYNPEAYSETVDEVLNNIACNDKKIRMLLEETIGYCFYRRNELGTAFILTGDKSNGKSTFLSMIQNLLGYDNIASLDLKELSDRFKTAELFGKLACIGDDIGDEFIANPAIFKKLVTGERVTAERKGQNPFQFNNYSKLLFSANNIPRIKDKTGAVLRRLTIIPFEAVFSKNNPNFKPYIKYELQSDEAMEYLIKIGIDGLKRVILNRGFTTSNKVQNAINEYNEINNPILGFFKECEAEEFQIENEPTNKVYKRYQEYCISNSLQPMSNIEFSKQVKRILNYEVAVRRINNKTFRVFIKEE